MEVGINMKLTSKTIWLNNLFIKMKDVGGIVGGFNIKKRAISFITLMAIISFLKKRKN